MKDIQEQNWQPIRMLPMLSKILNEQFEHEKKQYNNTLVVKDKPHVFDSYTAARVKKIYTEQLEITNSYERQFNKWIKEEEISTSHSNEITQLQK